MCKHSSPYCPDLKTLRHHRRRLRSHTIPAVDMVVVVPVVSVDTVVHKLDWQCQPAVARNATMVKWVATAINNHHTVDKSRVLAIVVWVAVVILVPVAVVRPTLHRRRHRYRLRNASAVCRTSVDSDTPTRDTDTVAAAVAAAVAVAVAWEAVDTITIDHRFHLL